MLNDANRRFGRYQLVAPLGRGGMAEVWKAQVAGPGGFARAVVVKRILPEMAAEPRFVELFMREARLSALLHHANIVQVHDLGEADGQFFIAMEFVDGVNLCQLLNAQSERGAGPPPPGLGALVVREICRALDYAHRLTDEEGQPLGLLHRDVSPSNVMLGFEGAVKLFDFGIAKAAAETGGVRTATGMISGKLGYLAPELVEGHPVDGRADLFAAGVVLHEALTGRRLFRGSTDVDTLELLRVAKAAPPSSTNPAVSPELDRICRKALARDVGERYATGGEMAADLEAVTHELRFGAESLAAFLRTITVEADDATVVEVEVDVTQTAPRPRRRRGIFLGAAALAVGSLCGALAWWRAPLRLIPPAPVAVAAQPAARAQPSAPAVAAGRSVHFVVTSVPAAASVFLDDGAQPVGRTPLALLLARGDALRRVRVACEGYQSATTTLTPSADGRIHLTLMRRPAVHRPSVEAPRQPNLRGGAVVIDPFAP